MNRRDASVGAGGVISDGTTNFMADFIAYQGSIEDRLDNYNNSGN